MGSFLKSASKQVADVRTFLRDSAGNNGIKYTAEKGAKHVVYIPYTEEEVIDEVTQLKTKVKRIHSISGDVHEWTTQDGHFKACTCLKDVVIKNDNGDLINDGSCPFCDRRNAAWDINNYRVKVEEENCKLTGEARKTHLEKASATFRDERKIKEARSYMYILVVKYRLNEAGVAVTGTDGLPEYELKVMKLSATRVEKIQQQVANSGSEFAGSELIFEYPNIDDRRLLVGQSTTAPVFPNNMMTTKFPGLVAKINEDIAKFEWDGITKSFPEWEGMSVSQAKSLMDAAFEQWDQYTKELEVNHDAKYLEYIVATPATKPSISGDVAGAGAIPVVPQIPGNPGIPVVPTVPVAPVAPVAPPVPNAMAGEPQIPVIPVPQGAPTVASDANGVFAGATPTINV